MKERKCEADVIATFSIRSSTGSKRTTGFAFPASVTSNGASTRHAMVDGNIADPTRSRLPGPSPQKMLCPNPS
ncbi:MAG: hypothetical protein IPH49_00905 [Ignavibacteria bacterium]|nr:hypothetical protein [Ignavibacteria bacterium]